jgi:Trypsin-co-occurring domain 1
LSSLGELVKILEASIGDLPKRPDKIEMEFGAKLSTDCNLWIVSGEGEAEFKVTLSWEKGSCAQGMNIPKNRPNDQFSARSYAFQTGPLYVAW